MNTVNVSGRVPMLFNMSKYCVISSKSTTSFDEAPLICSFDVKSLMEFLRLARATRSRLRCGARSFSYAPGAVGFRGGSRWPAVSAR